MNPALEAASQGRGEGSSRPLSTRLRSLFPLIPDEDLARLEFYTSGHVDSMWGLGEKPAVLVIDMTTGFVENETASTFVPAGRECASRIAELLALTREIGILTIYTRGSPFRHEAEAGSWLRGRGMPVFESSNREEDRVIVASLAPRRDEIVVIKAKHSAFFGTQLHAMLNYLKIDSLIVTGVTTSGCIRATVNDGFALNYRIVLPIERVADRSQISHQVELFDMAVKYADVLPLAEVLAALAEVAGRLQPATT
jgi:maleamate amidohydrolase